MRFAHFTFSQHRSILLACFQILLFIPGSAAMNLLSKIWSKEAAPPHLLAARPILR
jgi:hypothetical protein